MTAPILTIRFHQPHQFRYFWIKYVRGFDPRNHCARCLVGDFSRALKYREIRDLERVTLDEYPAPWIYICGVTPRWEWNLHVAGHFENNANSEHRDDRVTVVVENLRRIQITSEGNPPAPREFATCRNWQFGWNAFPETTRERLLF